MRVAFVAREVYPYVGGGIAPIVAAAARQLSAVADVTIVTSAAHREAHERRGVDDGVRWLFVEEPDEDEVANWFGYMHAWSGRVYEVLRSGYPDGGPDLIEFCDYLGEGFVTIQARHTCDPWLANTMIAVRLHTTSEIVSVLDGNVPDDFATVSIFEAERYCLRHADRLLWSGGDVLDTYRRFYGADALAPATLLPDAFLVEDDPGDEVEGVLPSYDEPLRLLYVGRLERRKGVQNLIRAMTALPRADVELILLGGDTNSGPLGGSLLDQLEQMAADDPRIHFFESVPRAEVTRWIDRCHALVIPSLWECWPNTAREALMFNRPLIATPVGGLTELAQPRRSGVLVADTTPEALIDGLDRCLGAPQRELGRMVGEEGPRAVFDELTDPELLVERYRRLAGAPPRRPQAPARTADPLVSLVIPYFRLEKLVEETLRSALAQTYRSLELLLVVDGSLREEDAATFELAERLGVTVLTQVNSGLGAARNFGVEQSRGTYILPLDADDVIDPEFVARCVDVLERDPSLAYVTTWVQYMKPDGTPLADENGGYAPYGNWSSLIDCNNVAGTCTALFRRSVFDAGHGYSPDLTSFEDWLHYAALHDAGLLGAVIPERLFHYRVRDDSMMREIGAPSVERIAGEVRARRRERAVRWTGETAAAPAPSIR
jgi:glycogen(starch) synthase